MTVFVTGAGPGGEEFLTAAARDVLAKADVIFAAERHQEWLRREGVVPLLPISSRLAEMVAAHERGQTVAVLVSGDPGLFSLLPLLRERLPADALQVIPGISALQLFCARLALPWQDAKILSAHGRDLPLSTLLDTLRSEKELILFCDGTRNPREIALALWRAGMGKLAVAVGERLGYADERVWRGTVAEAATENFDPLSMMRIVNGDAKKGLSAGIADGEFLRGEVPMTKRELRCLIVNDLRLTAESVVWDIGAGTGSVSVECARFCPRGVVYAIEHREDALDLIEANRLAFGLDNLRPVAGEAPEILSELPTPSHVFLGGSGGRLREIIGRLEGISGGLRLVAAFVTLEHAHDCLKELERRGGGWLEVEALQLSVSRLAKTGKARMFRAQNPVILVAARREGGRS